MQIARVLFDRMVTLFRNDPANLFNATASFLVIREILAPFEPSPNLTLADLVLTHPNGVFALQSMQGAASLVLSDPVTDDTVLLFPCQNGQNLRVTMSSVTGPVPVYGLALVGLGNTVLFATKKFSTPFIFTKNLQGYDLPEELFRFPTSMVR